MNFELNDNSEYTKNEFGKYYQINVPGTNDLTHYGKFNHLLLLGSSHSRELFRYLGFCNIDYQTSKDRKRIELDKILSLCKLSLTFLFNNQDKFNEIWKIHETEIFQKYQSVEFIDFLNNVLLSEADKPYKIAYHFEWIPVHLYEEEEENEGDTPYLLLKTYKAAAKITSLLNETYDSHFYKKTYFKTFEYTSEKIDRCFE